MVGLCSLVPCAEHHCLQIIEDRVIRSDIEVSGQHHRVPFRIDVIYPVHYQCKSVLLGLFPYVVEMRVDIVESVSGFLQQCPGGRTMAGCIPAHRWLFRGLGKPECTPFYHFNDFGVIENGHVFTAVLPIFAPYSDALVFGQVVSYVADLEIECLLDSEDIRVLVFQHFYRRRTAVFPRIVAIVRYALSDVVRNHGELSLFCLPAPRQEQRRHQQSCAE